MENLYETPKSELLDFEKIKIKVHILWKIFFWIHVLVLPFLIPFLIKVNTIHILDYIGVLVFLLNIINLFGYIYSMKLGPNILWRIFCVLYPLWIIFYELISPFILNIPSYGDHTEFNAWLLIPFVFLVPSCIVLYLYAFKSKKVWGQLA